MFQHLELRATVQGFSLKSKENRFSICDLEEHIQVVLHDFLGVVKH